MMTEQVRAHQVHRRRIAVLRSCLAAGLVLLVALTAAGCGDDSDEGDAASKQSTPAGETTTIRLMNDWFVPWPLDIPWIVAMEKGWYEDAGLDVKFQLPQGSSAPARLLGAGKIDMAITYEPDTILTNDAGLPIKVLMALYNKTPGGIGFYKSSGIQEPGDLAGKTVAVYEDPFSQYGYKSFLKATGVDAGEVKQVPAGSDASKLLISGRVDAIQGADALEFVQASQAKDDAPVGRFDWNEDYGFPKLYSLILGVNGDWLTKNEDAARKFVEVTQRAVQWQETHQQEALDIYIKANPDSVDPEQAKAGFSGLKLTWCGETFTCWTPDKPIGWIDPAIWKGYADFLEEGGLLKPAQAADQSMLTDNSYLSDKYQPTP